MKRKNYDHTTVLRGISPLRRARRKEGFLLSADWCGDCRYIQPFLPEIEAENPEFTFVLVDRDQYLDLSKLWDIYGIPSLVVLDKDRELGRFVNRDRKTKAQISEFLAGLK